MVVLDDYRTLIESHLDLVLTAFAAKHPRKRLTILKLFSCPWGGDLVLSVGSSKTDHRDSHTFFSFKHVVVQTLHLDKWRHEYETSCSKIKLPTGKIIRLSHKGDFNDDMYNKPFYDFLVRLARRYLKRRSSLGRPMLVGVQMLDSKYVSYWRA